MTLQPGQQLSQFRLIQKIGEGGMGIVWEAEDTVLSRNVAIKVLPEIFAGDSERMARFEREARLLASLDHGNIAAIHELAESDGIRYLVLELVPGRTLSEIIEAGPPQVEDALGLGLQIAEGIEAAHELGVIHRDLKPANIKVTPEEKVKILDFGLAKALDDEVSSSSMTGLSHSPTITSDRTRAGVILGTAAYMSPEQARGKRVDRRADIWSFGCVLYETLTGRKVFHGETVSDTLAAILRAEPGWALLPEETPTGVRRLLDRCLQKDPRQRLRDIGEARIALHEALEGETSGAGAELRRPSATTPTPGSSFLQKMLLAGAGILVGVALSMAALWGGGGSLSTPEPPVWRLELPAGPLASYPVISPDGRRVAYAEDGRLWVRGLDELEPREIPHSEETRAFWSPDSQWIGFTLAGELLKVSADGAARMSIGNVKGGIDAMSGGAAWMEDGSIVFTTGSSGLLQIAARGGDPVPLLEPGAGEMDFHNVNPLPGGRGVVFIVHREIGVDTIAAFSDGERKDLLQLPEQDLYDPWYSPTGHLVYRRSLTGRGLWAVPFSLGSLTVTGESFLVVEDVGTVSISEDGALVYRHAPPGPMRLVWVDREGNVEGGIGQSLAGLFLPSISPDEARIAAVAGRENANSHLWVYDIASDAATRLTFGDERAIFPDWMPDDERIIYAAMPHGSGVMPTLTILRADGSGEPLELGPGAAPCVSSDGEYLAYMRFGASGNLDIYSMSLDEPSEPQPIVETPAMEIWPRISPDGRYVAYQSDSSGRHEIYLTRFPDGTGKWQVSSGGGLCPRWDKSGKKLFYLKGRDLMEVEIATGPTLRTGTPRKLFTRPSTGQTFPPLVTEGFDVTSDGERFVMLESAASSGIRSRIMVVQNWFAAFRDSE